VRIPVLSTHIKTADSYFLVDLVRVRTDPRPRSGSRQAAVLCGCTFPPETNQASGLSDQDTDVVYSANDWNSYRGLRPTQA